MGDVPLLRRVQRIPLDIVVTATGERTSGVMVCVLAADLDAYEERIRDLNNLAASVACNYEDGLRGTVMADAAAQDGQEAQRLWDRTWLATQEMDNADEADEQATEKNGRRPDAPEGTG